MLWVSIAKSHGEAGTWWLPDVECRRVNAEGMLRETLEASITQTQATFVSLSGKVQSLYMVKTEVVAGGKKVMAGLALGEDGGTGESQVNMYAQKFAVWDGQILKSVFAIVSQNGKTQAVLQGDLTADGTILSKHLAASQTLQVPTILGSVISGSLIRGARMETIDLKATNIIGYVVAGLTRESI